MWSIYRKELKSFFSSLIGYLSIGVFLLILGLMLWVFPDFSILEYEYASLDPLFTIAPFVLMFLIPAVTMSSFAEEKQSGTFEFLATKPISDLKIIMAKYLAAFSLVLLSLIPTLLYYLTVHKLGSPPGNLDSGAVMGSYIGLLLLGATFTSIGVFGSSLSNNQIVGFLVAFFLCFIRYLGFEFISRFPLFIGRLDAFIEQLGLSWHYDSISRGLIDSRDVVYFLSMMTLFVVLTLFVLSKRNWR